MIKRDLYLNNSLTKKKEKFEPLHEGFVGMYVCGPTVYSDVHLGNVRTFVSFDIIYRYLLYIGYKVRYVRNITDVGHLLDDGEDRISRGARLDQLEPMEVVQKYTNGFQKMMDLFNTHRPSIEPRATQHIIEQIEMVQEIIDNGYGYEVEGSVYFDTLKYHEDHKSYGQLSGRVIEDLISESREDLKKQGEKKHSSDFAIWMKAAPDHLMKWNSPWSLGFPGWHLECSVMSTKYLGETFDIHGGGNDLKFPHHENEIAQNVGSCGCAPCNYWLHTNMLLMNGKKMSKSDGNTISPTELITGDSPHVSQAYSPMAVKFFMLQSHYRSTLDLTDEGLQASEKGYKRLMEGLKIVGKLETTNNETGQFDIEINGQLDNFLDNMSDDFNTPKAIANLFELVTKINCFNEGHMDVNEIGSGTLSRLKTEFPAFITEVLGLYDDSGSGGGNNKLIDGVMQLVLELRQEAREKKDWPTADKIRDSLNTLEIVIKDSKEGSSWTTK
ncbi:MAG: cysteine--tRNA ligase [Saprospiraceae bacterium]|nr:cysteine--tRNA ligase [Saprospiraceae bacterium]